MEENLLNVQKNQLISVAVKYHLNGNLDKAEKYYQKLLDQESFDPLVLSNYGVICKQKGKISEAISLYKKSISLFPHSSEAYSNLGCLLMELNKTSEAEYYLKKSIGLNPNLANAQYNLGCALKDLNKLEEAELATRKAIELDPKLAKAHANLGNILKNKGDLSKSKISLELALKYDKDLPRTYFILSLLESKKDDNNEWQEYLFTRKILEKKRRNELVDIYFARSNVRHKQKNYRESAQYLKLANDLKYTGNKNQLESFIQKTENIKIKNNPISHGIQINKKKSNIFIVGMPRSGSTLVESILGMNQNVFNLGENNIFENLFLKWQEENLTPQDFTELFSNKMENIVNTKKIITNKWLYNYQYTEAIIKLVPNAKIIHCQRNALDNILSIYRANFAMGNCYASSLVETSKMYLNEDEIMARFKKKYESKIFNLNYDSLVTNPEKEIKLVISWLGWRWNDIYLKPHLNKRPITTASSVQVRFPINSRSIKGWKNYKKMLKPAIEVLKTNQRFKDIEIS